uniref:Midasin n=1 Tax=Rhizophora mucronata TaxID=61149 RepID=A0A2P2PQ55_RHIMU
MYFLTSSCVPYMCAYCITFHISNADRLLLFADSYTLGVGMIKGDQWMWPSHFMYDIWPFKETTVTFGAFLQV